MGLVESPLAMSDHSTLPQRVAARLHERIAIGTYPSGATLPEQDVLAADFHVPPAVIGEAIALLASAGLVAYRPGERAVVVDGPGVAHGFLAWVREPVGRDGLLEAIEAREVIERAIVRLAALRRTEADLERLRASLGGMRTCLSDAEAFAEFDFALHVALSDAARNHLLAGTLAGLHELVREMIALFTRTAVREGRMGALLESHTQLVDTVERQEPDEAARIISEMMALLRLEADRRGTQIAEHAR